MSVTLHIVGDSNIDRYLPLVKAVKEDPGIQETTFTRATNLVQLQEALVPATPTVSHPDVILACMTNPITNFAYEDYNGLMTHCAKIFSQVQAWIQEGRGALPGTFRRVSSFLKMWFSILFPGMRANEPPMWFIKRGSNCINFQLLLLFLP